MKRADAILAALRQVKKGKTVVVPMKIRSVFGMRELLSVHITVAALEELGVIEKEFRYAVEAVEGGVRFSPVQ